LGPGLCRAPRLLPRRRENSGGDPPPLCGVEASATYRDQDHCSDPAGPSRTALLLRPTGSPGSAPISRNCGGRALSAPAKPLLR
jgi:hypothetical protein